MTFALTSDTVGLSMWVVGILLFAAGVLSYLNRCYASAPARREVIFLKKKLALAEKCLYDKISYASYLEQRKRLLKEYLDW